MAKVSKQDDLHSLIRELEDKQQSVTTASMTSTTGYVTVEEAAEIMEMEPNAVRKMMRKGEFRTARIGRRKFINENDARNYQEKAQAEDEVRMADPKRLLTVSEIADILRFSEAQVYDMLNKKILLGFRIGAGAGSWRIQKSDLDEYIGSQRERSRK